MQGSLSADMTAVSGLCLQQTLKARAQSAAGTEGAIFVRFRQRQHLPEALNSHRETVCSGLFLLKHEPLGQCFSQILRKSAGVCLE